MWSKKNNNCFLEGDNIHFFNPLSVMKKTAMIALKNTNEKNTRTVVIQSPTQHFIPPVFYLFLFLHHCPPLPVSFCICLRCFELLI